MAQTFSEGVRREDMGLSGRRNTTGGLWCYWLKDLRYGKRRTGYANGDGDETDDEKHGLPTCECVAVVMLESETNQAPDHCSGANA